MVLVAVAVALQVWAATQWSANMDSDEAVIGLMAREATQGHFVPYMHGQNYLGTFEVTLSAALMLLFGDSVLPFRASGIVLLALCLVCNAYLIRRYWGVRPALVSLALMALPSWRVLWWTYRPVGAFDAILFLGTASLLLVSLLEGAQHRRGALLFGLGGTMGLGIWVHPLVSIYLLALAVVVFLASGEWHEAYSRGAGLSGWSGVAVRLAGRLLAPLAFGLFVFGFFSSGCGSEWEQRTLYGKVGLAVVAAGVFGTAVWCSRRRARILGSVPALALGVVVGSAPQWGAWAFAGVTPSFGALPSCPRDIPERALLLGNELLPALWGLPVVSSLARYPTGERAVWIAAVGLALASLAHLFWIYRGVLKSLLMFRPLTRRDVPPALLLFMLLLPPLFSVLGSNIVNIWSVRYILIAWPATALAMALLLTRLAMLPRARYVVAVAAAAWVAWVDLRGYTDVARDWATRRELFSDASISFLERHLQERGVGGGYADYWITYSVNFLSGGRLNFAQLNGWLNNGNFDRCPRCTVASARMTTRAYLLWADGPPGPPTIERLIQLLRESHGAGAAFPWLVNELEGGRVLDRRTLSEWDVWIIMPQRRA